MYQKVKCTCRAVVLVIEPVAFLTSLLPSLSSLLKFPSNVNTIKINNYYYKLFLTNLVPYTFVRPNACGLSTVLWSFASLEFSSAKKRNGEVLLCRSSSCFFLNLVICKQAKTTQWMHELFRGEWCVVLIKALQYNWKYIHCQDTFFSSFAALSDSRCGRSSFGLSCCRKTCVSQKVR